MSRVVRFDIELSDEEFNTLTEMQKKYHRTRKNMCEALVKLLIRTHKEGGTAIFLDYLGNIKKTLNQRSKKE